VSRTAQILDRVVAGGRLTPDEAIMLLRSGALLDVGAAADAVRRRRAPADRVSYIIERNINYTNVCITYCTFCAFYRAPGDGESYVLPPETIHRKVEETLALGGTGILLQGGHHPDLPLSYYEEMLAGIKERYPIHIHGFSPSEIQHVARVSDLPVAEVLRRLRAAGLDSIPGGGAEILVDRVRERIAPLKTTADGQEATAHEFLMTLAVSRLFLDNVPHLQSSWLTQGMKMGQVALRFGADDMGSVMIEENVVSSAGSLHCTTAQEMVRVIGAAGFTPFQRDNLYRPVGRLTAGVGS
jgi:2-iminoacetate synthase ThiH